MEVGLKVEVRVLRFLDGIARNGGEIPADTPILSRSVEFLDRILSCRVKDWRTIDSLPVRIV